MSEAGVPGYESLSWSGIAVAAGTPRDVVMHLNREINAILPHPTCAISSPIGAPRRWGGTPEAFAEHAKRECDKWSRVIRDANIVVN